MKTAARVVIAALVVIVVTPLVLAFVLVLTRQMDFGIVATGSMAKPHGAGVQAGSVLLSWRTDQLDVGDFVVATTPGDGQPVSHRVVDVSADGRTFRMRGDANRETDTDTYSAGKAWKVLAVVPSVGRTIASVTEQPLAPIGLSLAGWVMIWSGCRGLGGFLRRQVRGLTGSAAETAGEVIVWHPRLIPGNHRATSEPAPDSLAHIQPTSGPGMNRLHLP